MATTEKYHEGIGRRKTSIARARITPATKASVLINNKTLEEYFKTKELQKTALEAFETSGVASPFKLTVQVSGGGISSQSVAVRHAISRALLGYDGELRTALKKPGFLTRDARAKERRKFGLKKARKAPQWSKR